MTYRAIDWAELIRRLRRTKALKQVALADQLGVDQATISRWERGTNVPEPAMQRRLRDLFRRPLADELLLKHSITVSLGMEFVSDRRRVVRAASLAHSRAHGIPQEQMPGRCNKNKLGPEVEQAVVQLWGRGFYHGDVASAIYVARGPTLSGHRSAVPVKVVWTPVRLADEIFLRGERAELSESEFQRELALGPLRFVMMDELVC